MEKFDRQQGLSEKEKKHIAETDIDALYSKIKKEHLYREVMRNVHFANNKKYLDGCIKKSGLNKKLLEDTIKIEVNELTKDNPKLARNQYQEALRNRWRRKNSTIALLQALAVKCVENIKYKDKYENVGDLLHKAYFNAKKPIDGYMGPNTMLVFAKIAGTELNTKPKGQSDVIAFNGMITPELIMKMYRVCNPLEENKITFTDKKEDTISPIDEKPKRTYDLPTDAKIGPQIPEVTKPKSSVETPSTVATIPDIPKQIEKSSSDKISETAAEIIALQKEAQAHPEKKAEIEKQIKAKQQEGQTEVDAANQEVLIHKQEELGQDVAQIEKLRKFNKIIVGGEHTRTFDQTPRQETTGAIYSVYNEAHEKVLDIGVYTQGEYQGCFYVGKGDKVLQVAKEGQRLDAASIALNLDKIIKKLQN